MNATSTESVAISRIDGIFRQRQIPKPFWTGRVRIATGIFLVSASETDDGAVIVRTDSQWGDRVFTELNDCNFSPSLLRFISRILGLGGLG
jgi:hypothetical protein